MFVRFPCIALLVVCALLPDAVLAAGKDFVLLKNGDRITGEIKKIWNGEVFIEPEYGDEYAIELEYVAYVHTVEDFEVEFREGRKTRTVIGYLDLDEEQQPAVIVDDGKEIYPLAKVDNMVEIEEFFDWEVRSDLSVNVSTGNSDTSNTRFYAFGELKLGNHRHQGEFTRDAQLTDGEPTKEQTDVTYQDTWTFDDDWFVRGWVSWTRDPIKDLASRTRYFAGPGYHFWDDSKRTLNLSVGPIYSVEDIGEESDKSSGVMTMFRYEQKFFRDDLVLFQNTDLQRITNGRENKLLQTSTGARFDFTDDFYITLQVDYDHESNPAEGREKEDMTYLVGFGLEID